MVGNCEVQLGKNTVNIPFLELPGMMVYNQLDRRVSRLLQETESFRANLFDGYSAEWIPKLKR